MTFEAIILNSRMLVHDSLSFKGRAGSAELTINREGLVRSLIMAVEDISRALQK